MSFAYKEWKKISKEVKRQGKRLKAIRINDIDKKKKKRVFYVKLLDFIQCRTYFRPFMHAMVA